MKALAASSAEEQPKLRLDDQADLDSLLPGFSRDDKGAEFANWRPERGVGFSRADLSRKEPANPREARWPKP